MFRRAPRPTVGRIALSAGDRHCPDFDSQRDCGPDIRACTGAMNRTGFPHRRLGWTLTTLAIAAVFAPSAAGRTVDVSAPLFESPGGTVPVIVTVDHVPRGYRAAISARGTRNARVTCLGDIWINRIRRTASRKCYLRLPTRRGTYNVVGRAHLTKPGSPTIRRSGAGSRPVAARGYRAGKPMSVPRMQAIERCFNGTDRVWLTFDDGGSPAQVKRILATLRKANVRGRFFFTGIWARRYRTLMKQIKREGHLVANHSYSHAALNKLSKPDAHRELRGGVRPTTVPRLLRPPFAAGAFTSRLQAIARAHRHRLCRWTVDTYDWQGVSARRMAERIRYGDAKTPPVAAGGNILMHGTGRNTSTGLRRIIRAVRSRDLVLDPLR